MQPRTTALLALLAACVACASRAPATATAAPAHAAAPATRAGPAPTADDPAAVLPGVDLSGLTPEQARLVAEFALQEFCYCGCPHTLSECLRVHASCRHAPRMAALAVRYVRAGATRADLARAIGAYYDAFDRRARLDVSDFGPPLGNADAPIALVEFSDFTCPFCQRFRPQLEAFVRTHADRVKLFYKPFPIDSHPNAWEAAQAGEWARAHDLFWPMHDRMFEEAPALTVDDLVGYARALGGDASDLRQAIASGTYRGRIEASRAEARTAGIRGTPTLFMDGRMISDLSEDGLEHALEDEEEWRANHGWIRD
jgi:protein-disulfide isomerase